MAAHGEDEGERELVDVSGVESQELLELLIGAGVEAGAPLLAGRGFCEFRALASACSELGVGSNQAQLFFEWRRLNDGAHGVEQL